MKLSVCLIVKNEEQYLSRCLESIAPYADEIIITDTWSNDSTIEIAKQYTDKIYYYNWNNDFSSARNFCQKYAEWDYILWLDADEYFEREYIQKLIYNLNRLDKRIDCIHIVIKNLVWWYLYSQNKKLKIVKNHCWYKWIWKTHEILDYYNNNQTTCITYNDVFFIHSFNPKWKLWYDIHSYLELFINDKSNSNIALDIIKYSIIENKTEDIDFVLKNIPYIHRLYIRKYTKLLNLLEEAWLCKEKTDLSFLIKKSIIINDRIYWKENKLIY